MTTGRRLAYVAFVTLVLAALSATAALASEEAPPAAPEQDGFVVEAVGLAALTAGRPQDEVQRDALIEAQRNALVQAHVAMHATASVADMRLLESVVRSWASGTLERTEVLDEGVVSTPHGDYYRVRIRARVRAGDADEERQPAGTWQPAARLNLKRRPDGDAQTKLHADLAEALERCGVSIVADDDRRPALIVTASVTVECEGPEALTNMTWHVAADGPGGASATAAMGSWFTSGGAAADLWQQRAAVAMAQDCYRVWGTTRTTVLRVTEVPEASLSRVVQALGSLQGARVNVSAEAGQIAAVVPTAGDPRRIVEPALARAGFRGAFEPVQTSMTALILRMKPAQAAPEAPTTDEQ